MPFNVNAPELELWREGLVDLLSTNLDGPGGLRGIDSRTVLARWSESVPDGTRPDLASMLEVARQADARWVVVGSLVGTATDVRLSADVFEVEGGAKVGTAQANGSAADILALVDELSVDVVRLLLGEDTGGQRVQNLRALTTTGRAPRPTSRHTDACPPTACAPDSPVVEPKPLPPCTKHGQGCKNHGSAGAGITRSFNPVPRRRYSLRGQRHGPSQAPYRRGRVPLYRRRRRRA